MKRDPRLALLSTPEMPLEFIELRRYDGEAPSQWAYDDLMRLVRARVCPGVSATRLVNGGSWMIAVYGAWPSEKTARRIEAALGNGHSVEPSWDFISELQGRRRQLIRLETGPVYERHGAVPFVKLENVGEGEPSHAHATSDLGDQVRAEHFDLPWWRQEELTGEEVRAIKPPLALEVDRARWFRADGAARAFLRMLTDKTRDFDLARLILPRESEPLWIEMHRPADDSSSLLQERLQKGLPSRWGGLVHWERIPSGEVRVRIDLVVEEPEGIVGPWLTWSTDLDSDGHRGARHTIETGETKDYGVTVKETIRSREVLVDPILFALHQIARRRPQTGSARRSCVVLEMDDILSELAVPKVAAPPPKEARIDGSIPDANSRLYLLVRQFAYEPEATAAANAIRQIAKRRPRVGIFPEVTTLGDDFAVIVVGENVPLNMRNQIQQVCAAGTPVGVTREMAREIYQQSLQHQELRERGIPHRQAMEMSITSLPIPQAAPSALRPESLYERVRNGDWSRPYWSKVGLSPDEGAAMRRAYEAVLSTAPVYRADAVAEYYYAGTDQEHWTTERDFPYLRPPAPLAWIELSRPSHIVSSETGELDADELPARWAVLVSARRIPDDDPFPTLRNRNEETLARLNLLRPAYLDGLRAKIAGGEWSHLADGERELWETLVRWHDLYAAPGDAQPAAPNACTRLVFEVFVEGWENVRGPMLTTFVDLDAAGWFVGREITQYTCSFEAFQDFAESEVIRLLPSLQTAMLTLAALNDPRVTPEWRLPSPVSVTLQRASYPTDPVGYHVVDMPRPWPFPTEDGLSGDDRSRR